MSFTNLLRGLITSAFLASNCCASHLELMDLPVEKLDEIISFLPAHDIASLGMCNKQLSQLQQAEFNRFKRDLPNSTFNNTGYAAQDLGLIETVPLEMVHQPLRDLMAEHGFIAVPLSSRLPAFMPCDFNLAQLSDWVSQMELAKPLYHAAFGKELPEEYKEAALLQLMSLLGTLVYVTPENPQSGLESFLRRKSSILISHLKHEADVQPFVNSLHGVLDEEGLKLRPHTFVLTDKEFKHENFKRTFEEILAAQGEHHLHLSLGFGSLSFSESSYQALRLYSHQLPKKLKHLAIHDPTGSIQMLFDGFLQNTELRTAQLTFPRVERVNSFFGSGNKDLQTLIARMPKLLYVESFFICDNDALEQLYLHFPRLAVVKDQFLCSNRALKVLQLHFHRLRSVGDSFISKNCELPFLRLNVSKLEKIEKLFVSHNSKLETLHIEIPRCGYLPEDFICFNMLLSSIEIDLCELLMEAGPNFLGHNPLLPEEKIRKIRDYLDSIGCSWLENGSVRCRDN